MRLCKHLGLILAEGEVRDCYEIECHASLYMLAMTELCMVVHHLQGLGLRGLRLTLSGFLVSCSTATWCFTIAWDNLYNFATFSKVVRNVLCESCMQHVMSSASVNCHTMQFVLLTLQDTKTVVGKLELVIGVALHIIFIFFYLMVFNVSHYYSTSDLSSA